MKFRYENRTGLMKMNLISISLAISLEQSDWLDYDFWY